MSALSCGFGPGDGFRWNLVTLTNYTGAGAAQGPVVVITTFKLLRFPHPW